HHQAGHRHDAWDRARSAADVCADDRPTQVARAALLFAMRRDYSFDKSAAVSLLRRAMRLLPSDDALREEVLAALSILELSLPIRVAPQPFPGADANFDDADQARTAMHWISRPDLARPLADEALELARSR